MKPKHYNMKIDTFELWKQNKTPQERLIAAEFNVTKYIMRTKGCDYDDYEKIIAYSNYAKEALLDIEKELDLMEEYFRQEQNQ